MTTQMKRCEHKKIVQDYIERCNPYASLSRLGYRIADMSRYAAIQNRKISDLSADEAKLFAVGIV